MQKRYSLEINDFKEQVESGSFYVDKSLLIKVFLKKRDAVTLIARPEGFGKSLSLSMLRYFLDIEEDSRSLFKGLAISSDAEAMSHINKYPLIYLNFGNVEGGSLEETMQNVRSVISAEYRRFSKVKNGLKKYELARFEGIEAGQANDTSWDRSLLELTEHLYEYYGEQAFVLVDEYDGPISRMCNGDEYEELEGFLMSLYAYALKGNRALERGFMTGTMTVSRGSIFGGFNNMIAHTIFSKMYYVDYFGFSEEEIRPLIEEKGLSMEETREWYGGYNFNGKNMYNPLSVMSYIKCGKTDPYWGDMRDSRWIEELVKKGGPRIKYGLELLLSGEMLAEKIEEYVSLKEPEEEDIWSMFLQRGCLTYEEAGEKVLLKLPNRKMESLLADMIRRINEITEQREEVEKVLEEGSWKGFEIALKESVLKSINYYNTGKDSIRYPENFYCFLLLGMLRAVKGYEMRSNLEEGLGRANTILERKDGRRTVVMGLSAGDQYSNMEGLLEDAKEQISRKKYSDELRGSVTKLAVAFMEGEVAISEVSE